MEKLVEAHMAHCKPEDRPSNLINHISDHDGTRRSEQACYIIEKFNPENAKDMAFVLFGNKQPVIAGNKMHDYYPMFWEDKKLIEFCHHESQIRHDGHFSEGEDYDWYMKNCVGAIDDIDIYADVWKLSPNIKNEYPTEETWGERFKDSGIITGLESEPFKGWHNFRGQSEFFQNKFSKMIKEI